MVGRLMEVRRAYLQLSAWRRPSEIVSMYDYDIEPDNLWIRGWSWVRGDWMAWALVAWAICWQGVAAWQVAAVLLDDAAALSWSVVGGVFGALTMVQLGWAVAGVRADAWAHGVKAGRWWGRLVLAWLLLLPFAVLPGIVVGALSWWLFPVQLHLRVWGASRGNPGLLFVGRFVQYHAVWCATSQDSHDAMSGARFVVACRSAVFDGLQVDLWRYTAPMVWLLVGYGVPYLIGAAWSMETGSLLAGFENALMVGLWVGLLVCWAGVGAVATLINVGANAVLGAEWRWGGARPEGELAAASGYFAWKYAGLSAAWSAVFAAVGYVAVQLFGGANVLEVLPFLRGLRNGGVW